MYEFFLYLSYLLLPATFLQNMIVILSKFCGIIDDGAPKPLEHSFVEGTPRSPSLQGIEK